MTAREYVLAEFSCPKQLLHVAKACSDKGYKQFETYSPFPIHGMDDAMNLKPSPLGWIVLCGGTFGLLGGFGLQTWVSTVAYKLVISGKPFFSYPAFVPVTFELMVLFSAFATVFGMFALIKLPRYHHPLFKSKNFRKVTSHGFFLSIDSNDELYDEESATTFLKELNGTAVEVIQDA
ncbi:DUF3341 domain-containing protein [Candidatus Marinamargulisbacteria bacterium SCGC AG-343-D04]|nr:DUF3341 domain-containing protein [Candidatus Marinamargulisbacteria bacterium SCGC AG-343-D04]